MEKVRPILRGTFPYYYLAVIALSALATIVAIFVSGFSAIVLGAICLSTVYARQGLMPMINRAADAGDKAAFGRLHGASVVIQLIQIGLCGWVVAVIGWL